ncbi:cytochrome b5 domain-containing protein 1 [Toxorhynchites rutilus septentrionalis]|uniref:cytochrome b5 domain-containing protein 1 n=1 Tax=Toxorhynchites rutilus septentrionalis TaxID=329112 RepID=UPI002479750C|nr:cytochrome b5 domain-containing protein 1 [Toxorhynchites rutilus septentrionalis]
MVSIGQNNYFLRDEVAVHNQIGSAWVIIHGNVFDITALFDGHSTKKLQLFLLAFAGKDLSVYFSVGGRPIYRVSKDGVKVPVFPPVVLKNRSTGKHWWNDKSLKIGKVTTQERTIRVLNNLTFRVIEITVCEEDTIAVIQDRFLRYNENSRNYTWRRNINMSDATADLQLDKTLTENGILPDRYPPAPLIWIFYQIPHGNNARNTDINKHLTNPDNDLFLSKQTAS